MIAVPTGQQDTEKIARAFVANVVLKYGTPRFLQISLTKCFETPARSLRSRKFYLLRFIPNCKVVLRGAIVCWLSTSDIMWKRVRPTGKGGFISQPTVCSTTVHSATGLPSLSCCSIAPPPYPPLYRSRLNINIIIMIMFPNWKPDCRQYLTAPTKTWTRISVRTRNIMIRRQGRWTCR